ncbi:MAG TPA: AAA family ATPase [Clostridiaceae bacterium]|nr:AAA family ATPase [Clostridiaceae bacterium]
MDISTYGLLITSQDGIILEHNHYATELLNAKDLKNVSINKFRKALENYPTQVIPLGTNKVYLINHKNGHHHFLDDIIKNSNDEIFVTDNHGIAIYCNDAFEKNYGLSKDFIIGKDIQCIEEQGYVNKIMVHQVIKQKKTITFEQHTIKGKTILNTSKPLLDDNGNVLYVIENCRDITENTKLKEKIGNLNKELKFMNPPGFKRQVRVRSPKMLSLYATILNLSKKNVNILLLGDSGTGKTFLASQIHKQSERANQAFIKINCTTIPESLIESELFGYKKGAFTGASSSGKEGIVQQADGGTLFLDEIGELPIHIQSKLLELVENKTFLPIGGIKPISVDIRIIAATNRDLPKLVKEGSFREDLYFRLALGTIKIPNLSERKEDIPEFIDFYLDFFNDKYNTRIKISTEAKILLNNYSWPGNIRELENLIEFLIINSSSDIITVESLPLNIVNKVNATGDILKTTQSYSQYCKDTLGLNEEVELFKGQLVREAYKDHPSSYKLSHFLKVSQSTANRLINKYCNNNA